MNFTRRIMMAAAIKRAVVIGGSMAGLLAARVLADHAEQVTLIERDKLDADGHRPGVPQARHTHGLLARGLQIIDRLFPGFERELAESGAVRVHWMRDTIQLIPTGWTPRFDSGLVTYACSRPHVEKLVRRRLRALANVRIMDGFQAVGLRSDDARRVIGVTIEPRPRRSEDARDLAADLVVDASGRGSQTPAWLAALGCGVVEETRVDARLAYATQSYRMPPSFQPDWNALMMMTTPSLPRGGVFQLIEDGVWMLTLAGTNGDAPPTDVDGLRAFAATIPAPPLHHALDVATPITPIFGYQRTGNLWRHYERLERMPSGFVVLGDAVCAFNPVYGQGMTAAAMAVEQLDRWLRGGGRDGKRFQAMLARSNQAPWLMATNEDWRYPLTEGAYPGKIVERLNGYVDWLFDAAPDVPQVTQTFLRVMHLVTPSVALFNPSLILKRALWRPAVKAAAQPAPGWEA
jgi:2-polyprenyl-6-methoxyphenol hydroxylase-like FAD-dependent oxidoreductase